MFVTKELFEAGIATNSEVSNATVFEDDEVGLVFAIELGVGQLLSHDDAVDPKLTVLRKLETWPTVTPWIHHSH